MKIKLLSKHEGTSQKGKLYMILSCTYLTYNDKPCPGFIHAQEFFVEPDLMEVARKLTVGKDFEGKISFYANANHLVNIEG